MNCLTSRYPVSTTGATRNRPKLVYQDRCKFLQSQEPFRSGQLPRNLHATRGAFPERLLRRLQELGAFLGSGIYVQIVGERVTAYHFAYPVMAVDDGFARGEEGRFGRGRSPRHRQIGNARKSNVASSTVEIAVITTSASSLDRHRQMLIGRSLNGPGGIRTHNLLLATQAASRSHHRPSLLPRLLRVPPRLNGIRVLGANIRHTRIRAPIPRPTILTRQRKGMLRRERFAPPTPLAIQAPEPSRFVLAHRSISRHTRPTVDSDSRIALATLRMRCWRPECARK